MSRETGRRRLARWIAGRARQVLPPWGKPWADAMENEIHYIEGDSQALRWAVGCLLASGLERLREELRMDAKERRQLAIGLRTFAPWALALALVTWLGESAFEALGIGRRWHDALALLAITGLLFGAWRMLLRRMEFDESEKPLRRIVPWTLAYFFGMLGSQEVIQALEIEIARGWFTALALALTASWAGGLFYFWRHPGA